MTSKSNITCPHCGAKKTWRPDNPFKPFCSERCKLIDFGDWASEKHRVAGEAADFTEGDEDSSKTGD